MSDEFVKNIKLVISKRFGGLEIIHFTKAKVLILPKPGEIEFIIEEVS